VLYISNGHADEVVAEPGQFDNILRDGHAVCAIAVRGTGLSTPRPPRGGPAFYQQMDLQERFAWANLVLGTSVIGQRVWDTLRSLDYLCARQDVEASQIRMIGQDEAGLPALMATALDARVRSVFVTGLIATYMSVVESADYYLALDWFVPGILRQFDLPDISASISPRPIWMVDTVAPTGKPLSADEVRTLYLQRVNNNSAALEHLKITTPADRKGSAYLDWLRGS
jgi:hypothetical protein